MQTSGIQLPLEEYANNRPSRQAHLFIAYIITYFNVSTLINVNQIPRHGFSPFGSSKQPSRLVSLSPIGVEPHCPCLQHTTQVPKPWPRTSRRQTNYAVFHGPFATPKNPLGALASMLVMPKGHLSHPRRQCQTLLLFPTHRPNQLRALRRFVPDAA